jgi:hypothetical protein
MPYAVGALITVIAEAAKIALSVYDCANQARTPNPKIGAPLHRKLKRDGRICVCDKLKATCDAPPAKAGGSGCGLRRPKSII